MAANSVWRNWRRTATASCGLDLLTLSACETAVSASTDATGRELEGLAWLARQRGARNVLADLAARVGPVDGHPDGRFYAALAQGKGKPQALRQAQLRQIRAARHAVTATRGLTPLDAMRRRAATRAAIPSTGPVSYCSAPERHTTEGRFWCMLAA